MELDMSRYIHGQPGNFDEIRILVEGGASYTSDIDFPDQLFAYFLRSNQAHAQINQIDICLLYTSPSPRDRQKSRMPSSA